MGKEWGNLAYIRGMIYYRLSPHELKPFANWVDGMVNFIPRAFSRMYTWLPPFLIGIATYRLAEDAYHDKKRKHAEDFVDEVDTDPRQICKRMVEIHPPMKQTINWDDITCPPPDEEAEKAKAAAAAAAKAEADKKKVKISCD